MRKISLLDCTLRDGGYLNNWNFGEQVINDVIHSLEAAKVEILELGFIRDEPYNKDCVVFNCMQQVKDLIGVKKEGILYSVMAELLNPVPLGNIEPASATGIDVIRMIVWKDKTLPDGRVVDAIEEAFEYCKSLTTKGYKLCIQPVRVNQYNDEDFIYLLKHFSELNPMAIYVVDSWGTDNPEDLLHYMHLADQHMAPGIAIGYHGHNNMMHALAVAQEMLRTTFERDIIIDASVYGVGRGAGNLNLEIIAKYMNERYGKGYDLYPMLEVYDKYIQKIYQKEQWGYSVPFLLTAIHKANPRITRYMVDEMHLNMAEIRYVLEHLAPKSKIIFNKKDIDKCIAGCRK